MTKDTVVDRPAPVLPMLQGEFIGIVMLGAVTGVLVWGFGLLLDRFVFDVYFCQGEVSRQCSSAKNYAAVAAGLVGAMAALGGLVRLGVYRPLLIVIASMLSLWGLVQLCWGLHWLVGLVVAGLLYAVAFGLYAWIARVREFWIALVVMVFLVVAVRLVLVA